MNIFTFEGSSDLENLPLLNIELTLILLFSFLDDLLKICFPTRCLFIFTTIDEKKEEQKSTYQILLKDVTEEKNLDIYKHRWLLVVWIFKKLNSFKLCKLCHKLYSYLQSKSPWTNLFFIIIIALSLFRFGYRESAVAAPTSFYELAN